MGVHEGDTFGVKSASQYHEIFNKFLLSFAVVLATDPELREETQRQIRWVFGLHRLKNARFKDLGFPALLYLVV